MYKKVWKLLKAPCVCIYIYIYKYHTHTYKHILYNNHTPIYTHTHIQGVKKVLQQFKNLIVRVVQMIELFSKSNIKVQLLKFYPWCSFRLLHFKILEFCEYIPELMQWYNLKSKTMFWGAVRKAQKGDSNKFNTWLQSDVSSLSLSLSLSFSKESYYVFIDK